MPGRRLTTILIKAARLGGVLILLALAAGCALPDELVRRATPFVANPKLDDSPRLNAFLALKDSRAPAVRLDISRLEILAGDLWLPVLRQPMVLDSAKIGDGQLLLDGAYLPPGSYQRVRLTVSQGWLGNVAGEQKALLAEPLTLEVSLTSPLKLDLDDSRCLFFTWDVASSLAAEGGFRPALTVTPASREFPRDLVYVSCPDIDTIFVVRADTNRVVESFGVKGRPTWIALDREGLGQRLYVLTPGDRRVKAIDLSTYRTVDFFAVPLNDTPSFMTLDPLGRSAYLLDERNGYLNRLDLSSGRIMARAQVGFRPQYAGYLEEQNLLAVSLAASQKVVLLDPVSLAVRGALSTGSRPQGLLAAQNRLYVAEQGDSSVSVFDLGSLAGQARITVGFDPGRLLDTGNQIYVSHEMGGMLSVLVPGQLGVFQEIHGLGRPGEMVFHRFLRQLFVADREGGGVSVVDVNANRLLTRIPLGAMPVGLAVTQ